MSVTVALVEDNLLVREGIAALLEAPGTDVEVVSRCDSLDTALSAVEQHGPDVVVTDIRMPPGDSDEGVRLARSLQERRPEIGVVLLSNYSSPVYALALLEGGSEGRAYLLKERVHDGGQLLSAIHAVAVGGSVIDPKVIQPLMASRARGERSPLADLTVREREVLGQIAEGKSNSAIAESLVLTKRAVEKHINAIFMKLDLAGAEVEVSKRVKATLMFLAELERRS